MKAATEQEWLKCSDPDVLLEFLRKNANLSERKRRLFGVAICRCIWDVLTDERSRNAVEAAARYAEGDITEPELETAYSTAFDVADALEQSTDTGGDKLRHAAWAAAFASHPQWGGGGIATEAAAAVGTTNENVAQADLMRCIFGNPLRPIAIDRTWLSFKDGTVWKMAKSINAERNFDLLPVLAEALMDAGCRDPDILDHCRQSGTHVRGCWVVDLLLGKE